MEISNVVFREQKLATAFKNAFPDLKTNELEKYFYQVFPLENNTSVHYELMNYNNERPEWHVEFHIECNWPDLRNHLWEVSNIEDVRRDFYYSSRYSSGYLKSRRPALTPEQVAEDADKLRRLLEPMLKVWQPQLQGIYNANICNSTCIQNLMPLGSLLKQNLCIPKYQRPYCWRKENVIGLIEDLKNSNADDMIHLGVIILKANEGKLEIIDGQQRLITLAIFVEKVLSLNEVKIPLLSNPLPSQNTTDESRQYLLRARNIMVDLYSKSKDGFDNILSNTIFSVVTLADKEIPDLAFKFFSHTNSAGMPLSDYDLLKTHHLRYLKDECFAERAALEWNQLTNSERVQLLHHTLFRLRKWSAGESFSIMADDSRLREVFRHFRVEMEPIEGCSSWPKTTHFDSILDGGEEFFAYISEYKRYYLEFQKHKAVEMLRSYFAYHSYGTLFEGMSALCFLFYCKFGERYLQEAAYCIAYRISELRNSYRVMQKYLSIMPIFNECTIILDRCTFEGEFFARLLDSRKDYTLDNRGKTASNYWWALYNYLCLTEKDKLRLPEQYRKSTRMKQMLDNKEN